MKKWTIPIILGAVIGVWWSQPYADSLYTWTDEKGQTHITQDPPPPGASIKDTIEYVPKMERAEDIEQKSDDVEAIAPRSSPALRETGAAEVKDERKAHYDSDGGRYTRRAIGSELKDKGKERPRPVKKRHRKR